MAEEDEQRQPSMIPWVAKDVVRDAEELQGEVHTLVVDVAPGEVLYLPAMWFHRVSHQTNFNPAAAAGAVYDPANIPAVVAVNYWYDMQFNGPTFHLQQYVKSIHGTKS